MLANLTIYIDMLGMVFLVILAVMRRCTVPAPGMDCAQRGRTTRLALAYCRA
jgi:hypothetical protein